MSADASSDDESSIEFELELAPSEADANAAADDEEECSVCHDVLWEPVRLPLCGHVFCRACLADVLRRGEGNTHRCPLCRGALPASGIQPTGGMPTWLANLPTVAAIEQRLREQDPDTFERRRAEAELRAASCITVLVGQRGVTSGGRSSVHGVDSCDLFVEVVPPSGWRPRRPNGPGASAMLIDMVRVTLPPEVSAAMRATGRVELEGGTECIEVPLAPFEVHGAPVVRAARDPVARMCIFWKRKLGMPPLEVEHVMLGGASSTVVAQRHEARLPDGLTLSRVLERARPVARVNSGSRFEREIFR